MDQSIGRFVAALKRLGQFENTLILFLSDNGGCGHRQSATSGGRAMRTAPTDSCGSRSRP
ncbi:MAG: sulfatase-like hydrolase/transferase [Pseudomonadales bacterium]|nr:sulfatase-like hydrolase/transferase [Pseudomonadales bacterium]